MDVISLIKALQDAVAKAQALGQAQLAAHSKMVATISAAKAQFEAVEKAAKAEFQTADKAYHEAKVAVDGLKTQVNDALGGLLAAADARVRIG